MRRRLFSLLVLGALVVTTGAVSAAPARRHEVRSAHEARSARSARDVLRRIEHYQDVTWRWERLMGRPRTRIASRFPTERATGFQFVLLRLWQRRALRAWQQARRPPHRREWLCIHRYEGSWADPNPPYYGGLQMDLGFQRSYGSDLLRRKGTADHWTPLEQMWIGERAYRSGRGFWPWPNTARMCGLL